jgi:hypothetical protein
VQLEFAGQSGISTISKLRACAALDAAAAAPSFQMAGLLAIRFVAWQGIDDFNVEIAVPVTAVTSIHRKRWGIVWPRFQR